MFDTFRFRFFFFVRDLTLIFILRIRNSNNLWSLKQIDSFFDILKYMIHFSFIYTVFLAEWVLKLSTNKMALFYACGRSIFWMYFIHLHYVLMGFSLDSHWIPIVLLEIQNPGNPSFPLLSQIGPFGNIVARSDRWVVNQWPIVIGEFLMLKGSTVDCGSTLWVSLFHTQYSFFICMLEENRIVYWTVNINNEVVKNEYC